MALVAAVAPSPVGEGWGEGMVNAVKESHDTTPGAGPTERARRLRNQATDAERALWRLLRGRHLHGAKFRRQQPYGPYVLDFYCHEHRLAIEADGGQHLDSGQAARDSARTRYLEEHGV